MNKLHCLFAVAIFALFITSCNKEEALPDITPKAETQQVADDIDYIEFDLLEEDFLTNEKDILQALGVQYEEAAERDFDPLIYTLSNEAGGNQVIKFRSNPNGTIFQAESHSTGGTGSGSGLGNQGAMAFNASKGLLYVVNAGSNEISFFSCAPNGNLALQGKVNSGGIRPVSVTVYRGVIYVLNAGSDNFTGFVHNRFGQLVPLPNSTRSLSGSGTAPAQISFARNGRALIITEKATNTITTYTVDQYGRPGNNIHTFPSVGAVPFGFGLGHGNSILVSEAGGTGEGSVATSYFVSNTGQMFVMDGPLQLGTAGACWVVMDKFIRNAYVMNTGSNNISSLSVNPGMQLGFSNFGNTTNANSGPLDGAMDRDFQYLYVLGGGNNAILTYRVVGLNGQLTQIDTDGGLPDHATGLVVKN